MYLFAINYLIQKSTQLIFYLKYQQLALVLFIKTYLIHTKISYFCEIV